MESSPVDPAPVRSDAEFLVHWLADRDLPCPACGYNLHGLTASACPECGRGLRLGVSLTEPALGTWIATLVPLLLPAGFGIILIVVYISEFQNIGVSGLFTMPVPVAWIVTHLVLSVPLSVLVLLGRRRFLKLSWPAQAGFVLAAWAALSIDLMIVLSKVV